MTLFGYLFFSFLPVVLSATNSSLPIVKLPLGNLQGTFARSYQGRTFYQFEGVPFAKPPVGDLRFKSPKPVSPWKETFVADTVFKCLQYTSLVPLDNGEYAVEGEEDCLYLNIYTPSLEPSENLDVIVFIHGGAFMFSFAGDYRPDFILDADVVYVTINYRLGPLGFLSTESDLVPGNNGIKDQILALQWVQKFIKYFGGNPKSVTLTGASAGGVSVYAHYLTPKSKALFHRGIARSGSILNPWGIMEAPLEKTRKLAAAVGCSTSSTFKLIECLKRKPARQIVHAVRHFQPFLYNPEQPWAICVDTWASDPLFKEHPYQLLKKGKINDVPMIVSYVTNEGADPGAELYDDEAIKQLSEKFSELMPHVMEYNYTIKPDQKKEVGDKIKEHYFGDQLISKENFKTLLDAISDRNYFTDIYKTMDIQRKVSKSDIYLYYFKYQGENNLYPNIVGLKWGPGHYEDTPYILKMGSMDTTTTKSDRAVTQIFMQMYTSFSKTGKPLVDGVEWHALKKDQKKFEPAGLVIDQGPVVSMQKLSVNNTDFWESLPFQENEKIEN